MDTAAEAHEIACWVDPVLLGTDTEDFCEALRTILRREFPGAAIDVQEQPTWPDAPIVVEASPAIEQAVLRVANVVYGGWRR